MPATESQKSWNGGSTSKSVKQQQISIPRPDGCHLAPPNDDCGKPIPADGPVPHGFQITRVPGSREPARQWCSPQCAAVGHALAELRPAS